MDLNLFDKYKNIEYQPTGTLFPVDLLDAVVKHVCPYCGNKLYPMMSKPLMFCKSKKHRNRFVIAKSKLK